jgi:hypothetical protein
MTKQGAAGAKWAWMGAARRAALLAALGLLAVPSGALAHPERPSYWPNPNPDTAVTPAAGGKVPNARTLDSAVTGQGPGDVRIVCQGTHGSVSMDRARDAIAVAKQGFRLRPTEPVTIYDNQRANHLLSINQALANRCRFHSVQAAVNASGNNDRVVIMPGRYTEPASRAAPTNDPRCAPSLYQTQANGQTAPSFEYQATCPNDQNLIYVQGREIAGPPPDPPLDNRQGIPASELGPCLRCNFQIEGSGPRPEDVILDAGKNYINPLNAGAKPGAAVGRCTNPDTCYTKHVVLRADRADGFVAKNLLTRGGREFGIYTEEIDGYLLDKTKFFWNADYGQLSFTSDHGVIQNCEGFGSGDSVVYPGAAPETGSQADTSFYPDAPRYNTTVTKCDLHGSALGYSGSMGNAVRITDNDIYGNVTGIASDTLSSGGHPGFPADSSQIDHNMIYSNNLDLYVDRPPVEPLVPVPLGTGIIYPGMNDARVHHNRIFDNWRFGAMLFAVPDALTSAGGAEGNVNPGISCPGAPQNGISTSCGNQFFANAMGRPPAGFRFPAALDAFGADHSTGPGPKPNGLDFWWDEFSGNTKDCWFNNNGFDGTPGSITGPGAGAPPSVLPSNCSTSVGGGDPVKTQYLIECSNGPDNDTGPTDCDWWRPAPKPQTAAASRAAAKQTTAFRRYARTKEAHRLLDRMKDLAAVEGHP